MTKNRFHGLMVIAILFSGFSGCSTAPIAQAKAKAVPSNAERPVELPHIHDNAIPYTGSVVEYWPDGRRKSERTYKEGRMVSAIYYASNGRRVYEMAENQGGK